MLCLRRLSCGSRASLPGMAPYLDHLMFTLSPATTQGSLAVSPSGTITVGGSPVIVSSSGSKEEALSATTPILSHPCHLTSKATGPSHPSD